MKTMNTAEPNPMFIIMVVVVAWKSKWMRQENKTWRTCQLDIQLIDNES